MVRPVTPTRRETLQPDKHELDIPREKLPKLVRSAQQVGTISAEAAKMCRFAEGMPIVTGGGDQQCAGVGSGVIKPNSVEVTLGTAGVALAFLDSPQRDEQRRIPCSAHAVPGKWESEGLQLAAGSAYRWYRDSIADLEVKAALRTVYANDSTSARIHLFAARPHQWSSFVRTAPQLHAA